MRTFTATAILGMAFAAPANADNDLHWYLGVDFGQATIDVDKHALDQSVTGVFNALGFGVVSGSSDVHKDDLTIGVTVGFQPWKFLAFEAGYSDFGSAEYKARATLTDGESTFSGNAKVTGDAKGPTVSVLGILPIGRAWSLFGRAGVLFAHTNSFASATVDELVPEPHVVSTRSGNSDDTEEFLWGAGFGYTKASWTTRVEFQEAVDVGSSAGIGQTTIDRITIGAYYRF